MKKIRKSLQRSKPNVPHEKDDSTFQTIFNQSPVSTQIFSSDGTLIAVNKAWEKLWGVKLKDVDGYNILKDKQLTKLKIMPLVKKAFKGETVFFPQVRYEPNKTIKDVSAVEYRWTQSLMYAIKDGKGSVLKVVLQHEDITERKNYEEELRKREEYFRTSFEQTAAGISHTSLEGKWLRVNKKLCSMLGYSKDELLSGSFQDVTHPDDLQASLNAIKRLTKGRKSTYSFEKRYIKKDKTIIWANLTISLVKDSKGRNSYFISVMEDITRRKKAEEELRNERLRIYNLFMQAPAMICVLRGPEFIFEIANPLYLKVIRKKKNIIGKKLLDVLPELKGQPILDILNNVFITGKPYIGNETKVRLDINNNGKAEDTYFNFVYQPTFDAYGKIDGIMAHAIDVTAQVQARLQIEETEKQFRALSDNIPNLVWMADTTGYIFWFNSKWYEYTGSTQKETEGWGWQSVHQPDVLPKVLKQWKSSIKTGKPFNMVFPIKGADGVFRPFLTRVNPIKDNNGKVVRWFGTNTDITEQKELERQKEEFLAIASHELKTPITSMKAYGQVLQKTFEREGNVKAVSQLKKMDAQINKLTTLITDLLDVTKIQSGKLVMQEEYFDFNKLVVEVLEELQRTSETHIFTTKLAKTAQAYGDKERISQVVINLVSNAVKYSPHSDKIIIKSEIDKDSIKLCVQDFGIGIPKNKKDKVFEQFFRVTGEKQHTFPGLGLGLYISKEIIKRHGGNMYVESAEGKGSIFCFRLPLKR